MKMRITIIIALGFLAIQPLFSQSKNEAYHIAIEIIGLPETDIILAHRYGHKFFSDDTLKLDENGKGFFSGPESLPQGMYQLVLPDKTFLDFFVDEDQDFGITTKSPDFVTHNQAHGHRGNSIFFNWHRASQEYRNSPHIQVVWDTTLLSLGDSMIGKFLSGVKPFTVPAKLKNDKHFNSNQLAQYTYYKEHFFDSIDLSDPRLLRTPLIFNKLNQFFTKVVPPQPDSISWYCDRVLEQTKPGSETFRFTLQHLLNMFAEPKIMGTDAVYVHLAQNYYLDGQADWIDEANLKMIEARVNELKDLLIGKTAPRVKGLQTPEGEIVDPFAASEDYIVLYFWEPDCGHCIKSTPELFRHYADIKEMNAEVYAINTRNDLDKWNTFIAEHELSWINLHAPYSVRELLEAYKAWSTPLVFILDKDKRIVAKDLSVSQVKDYLTFLSKAGTAK